MTSDRDLERIEAIFQEAADLREEERARFLDERCGGDEALKTRVEALLAKWDMAESLDAPGMSGAPADGTPLTEGPGTIIGRYKLLQTIGEGGFGVVYMAEQTEPVRRKVAFKIIKLGMDTREVVARFEAERQALAMMDHPNIAKVLDGGATETGRPYFVMELVRGVSITEYCDTSKLSTRERLELFEQVCQAVQHAHQKGVIHRDLKPSNVMVTLHDGKPVPKVIDFGIAKAMHARLTDKTLFTQYQRFIGSPAYMSPEQAEMSGLDVDTRTDIYSLGVLLYELLTGTTPFDTTTLWEAGLGEVQRVIREQLPTRPSARISTSADATVAGRRRLDVVGLAKRVRGDLDWIVMKALEKDRSRRYGTASDFATDVRRHLEDEPVDAGPPSTTYRARKFLARNRAAVISGAFMLLLLILGIIGTSLGMVQTQAALHDSQVARELAEASQQRAQESAERSAALTDFLSDTLALADPSVALEPGVSVRTLLDRTASRLASSFADQPDAEARLRATIGYAYASLSEWAIAEVHLRRSVELAEKLPDYGQAAYYNALWRLTGVLFTLERSDAFAMAQRARRVGISHVAAREPELAAVLDQFIADSERLAHEPDAEAVAAMHATFGKSVGMADDVLAAGDPLWTIVGDSYMHASYSLWYTPFEPESLPFHEQALKIRRRELPPDHPNIAETLSQLVGTLNRSGRAAEGEGLIRDTVESVRRVHPSDSVQVAWVEAMLGESLLRQGKYEEAEPLLVHSHDVIVSTIGTQGDFYAADSFGRMIQLYAGWGREDEAAPLRIELARMCATGRWLQPWLISRQVFGPEHGELLAGLDRLHEACGGLYYGVAGDRVPLEDLTPILDDVLPRRRELLADDDPVAGVVARLLLSLATSLSREAAHDASLHMTEETLSILRTWQDEMPAQVAEALAQLALLAFERGEPGGALPLAQEAYALMLEAPEYDHWFRAGAEIRVSRSLIQQGLHRQAEPMLLHSYTVLKTQLGNHLHTEVARDLLAAMYTTWGKPDEAAKYETGP